MITNFYHCHIPNFIFIFCKIKFTTILLTTINVSFKPSDSFHLVNLHTTGPQQVLNWFNRGSTTGINPNSTLRCQSPHTSSLQPPICTRLGKCTYYPLIKKINRVRCKFTKMSYQLNDIPPHITCELSNVIYLISLKNATNTMLVKPAGHLEKECLSINSQYKKMD